MSEETKVFWKSIITEEMVSHVSESELSVLLEDLDDAVANICADYGIGG